MRLIWLYWVPEASYFTKPAAPDVEHFNMQIELAKKNNVKFVCVPVHPMRYDLAIAKQMINDGAIGEPGYLKCNLAHGGRNIFNTET